MAAGGTGLTKGNDVSTPHNCPQISSVVQGLIFMVDAPVGAATMSILKPYNPVVKAGTDAGSQVCPLVITYTVGGLVVASLVAAKKGAADTTCAVSTIASAKIIFFIFFLL
jgi:hypothetical protein